MTPTKYPDIFIYIFVSVCTMFETIYWLFVCVQLTDWMVYTTDLSREMVI